MLNTGPNGERFANTGVSSRNLLGNEVNGYSFAGGDPLYSADPGRALDTGDPADFESMWQAPRPVMRRTVDGFRERWGDHDTYVRALGVDDGTAEKARSALRREE